MQIYKNISSMTLEEKRSLAKKILSGDLDANGDKEPVQQSDQKSQDTEIPAKYYKFDLFPGYKAIKDNAEILKVGGIRYPFFDCHTDISNNSVTIEKKEYINYSGYNYLGFSGDPEISNATKAAINQYGTSVSASRIVSGEIKLHNELEKELSDFYGVEDSMVFVSGYGTNISTIGHLFGTKDIIFFDSLSHNSIIAGSVLSGARRMPFPHNDWETLDKLLSENRYYYEKALIVTEGLFSMDGDIPDIPEIIDIKNKHKALFMIDEAHSLGVLGENGHGIKEYFNITPSDVDIWMGTLSKALASCGGYIAGSKALIEYLKYTAPGAIMYSTGIPPTNTAAALAAIRKLRREPEHVAQLQKNSSLFLKLAKEKGLDTGLSNNSPIIPIILKDSILCLRLADSLFNHGINVHPILYPAVPEDDARLRFFITAKHTTKQITYTVDTLVKELENLKT